MVVDGIEPTERFAESIQFEFFEYLYQHVLRKEDEWAAREVFRELYRANAEQVHAHRYDHKAIGCLYLYTTPHVLLDDLMAQPIGEGDIFSNANTIILMGRTKEAGRMGRALYVAKHRGSAAPTRSARTGSPTGGWRSIERMMDDERSALPHWCGFRGVHRPLVHRRSSDPMRVQAVAVAGGPARRAVDGQGGEAQAHHGEGGGLGDRRR